MTAGSVTKVALVEQVADIADRTKKHAEIIVDTVFRNIVESLHQGEKVDSAASAVSASGVARRTWAAAHPPVVVGVADQRCMRALGQLCVGELGEGAREDRLARHLALPLPAADPPQRHVGDQAVQQHARRRHVVDCLGHEGSRQCRAVLARTPRHPEAPGNPLLDTDDLESLHQLLLFPGQRTQHGLQLGEQRTLDRLPIGGEGTTQAVHGVFD